MKTVVRVYGFIVLTLLLVTFIRHFFGVSDTFYPFSSFLNWLERFDSAVADIDFNFFDHLIQIPLIEVDWLAFNFFRDFLNALVGFFNGTIAYYITLVAWIWTSVAKFVFAVLTSVLALFGAL